MKLSAGSVRGARRTGTAAAAAADAAAPAVQGLVRLGRRTKELAARLGPGVIAVIDHADLDALAARALARRRPAAVINNQPSISGRYPNRGPGVLLEADIPVYDISPDEAGARPDLFTLLTDGEPVAIQANDLRRADGTVIAHLRELSADVVQDRLDAARANLDTELLAFAENTLTYLSQAEERALLLDPVSLPNLRAAITGRPVLVAVRGESYEEDLQQLGRYLREQRPIAIAVDGAADTLLASGIRPDIILGDMDSVGDDALRCGAELIVHAYARPRSDGAQQAPGLARVESLGLTAQTFPVPGTSEDAALLLAYEKGADLIVAVGTHTNLEDFLDKGRRGMASTFLVRLKVGSRLVDARGVSRLYGKQEKITPLLGFLLLSGLFPIAVLLASTSPGRAAWESMVLWFRILFR